MACINKSGERLSPCRIPFFSIPMKMIQLPKSNDGTIYWKNNNEECKILPKIGERIDIIKKAHIEETGHRGIDATVYQIRKTHNWRNITSDVKEVSRSCKECTKNDQKTLGRKSSWKRRDH